MKTKKEIEKKIKELENKKSGIEKDINFEKIFNEIKIEISKVNWDEIAGLENAIKIELDLLERITHPNIVKYFGSFFKSHYLYIILEYCSGGSVLKMLKIIKGNEDIIRQYKSDLYPFACDFYIPSLDLYIECNYHWTHGNKLYEGTKEGLKEKSPSHIMRDDAAFYAVKGLVLGIKDKLSMVWSSGKEMGSTLYEGTKQSILKIANSVNDNMDLRPVISPVLDLSDVESGAGQINGMLNSRVSSNLAGYTSQLIDKNRMFNYELQINQNGSKEVVSAINNLTSRMDSLENAILNRPIEMDGRVVSKIVAPGVNKELGTMQMYARRGN